MRLAPWLAALAAALGGWIVAMIGWLALTDSVARAALTVPYLLMGSVLFGLPLVILLLAALVPLHVLLRSTVGVRLPVVLVAGVCCGLAARVAAGRLWGQPELGFLPIPVVIATGLVAAWAWWRTADAARASQGWRGTI